MNKGFLITVMVAIILFALTGRVLGVQSFFGNTEENEEIITEYFMGGDIWIRKSVDELSRRMTDIVRAVVLDSRVELINTSLSLDPKMPSNYRIHTVYQLKVLETFRGDAEVGDILEILQLGGRLGNRELVYFRHMPFEYGEELIFFMRYFKEEGFGHLPASFPRQGVFRTSSLSETASIRASESITQAFKENPRIADIVLESYYEEYPLTLTIGDLIRLTQENETQ